MTRPTAHAEVIGLLRARKTMLLLGQRLFTHRDGDSLRTRWLASEHDLLDRARAARQHGDSVAVGDALGQVLQLAWGAVVTSGFDSTLGRALAIPGRRLVTQVATSDFSANPTDASLRLYCLFGTVDRDSLAELPPADRRAVQDRRRVAVQMLSKLPEMLGPQGALAIEAWWPGDDWLRPADLALALTGLAPGQVHVFGLTETQRALLAADETFAILIEDGIVRTYPETLESVIGGLAERGELPPEARTHTDPDVTTIPVLKARVPADGQGRLTPADLVLVALDTLELREIETGQNVLRELEVSLPLPDDPQNSYQLFRELLSRGAGKHNHRHIRALAFRRPVLDVLMKHCLDIAKAPAPQERLVLLRGQSGAGKSVILCQLAVELRERGYPVIYAPPTTFRFDPRRAEAFARAVSAVSEAPVFVCVDGLLDEAEYRDFAETFASRLNKCVVVGTAYTFQARGAHAGPKRTDKGRSHTQRMVTTNHVDVNVNLSQAECDDLLKHLQRFVPDLHRIIRMLASAGAGHLFAALYRLLPEVRAQLKEQFFKECSAGAAFLERQIQDIERETARESDRPTLLAQRLEQALGDRMDEFRKERSMVPTGTTSGEMADAATQLFNVVMLATDLGHLVPQSLALRILKTNSRLYRGAFTAGLLDEREVSRDVYALCARNPLEGQIWVERHLHVPAAQMAVIEQVAILLEQRELQDDYCPELEFLVGVLRAIGPQGRDGKRLPSQYQNIAKLIASLRQKKGDMSPRLGLLEPHAVREWVKTEQEHLEATSAGEKLDAFIENLDAAERGLQQILETLMEREQRRPRASARRLLATIETERACVLGTMLGSLRRCLPPEQHGQAGIQKQADQYLQAASTAWTHAMSWSDDNPKAVDALCWILDERHKMAFSEESQRVACLSQWAEVIDRYEALDLSEDQGHKRDGRLTAFGSALGNPERLARIVEQIRAKGSPAADHLLARRLLSAGNAKGACEHLEEHCRNQLTSERSIVSLFLRAWWQTKTGKEVFFPHQRFRPALVRADWVRFAELLQARLAFEPENGTLRFLKAVALIQLGSVAEAVDILRDLDRLEVGGSRRSKSLFLHADEQGKPIAYVGTYQGKRNNNRLLVWCDVLRQNVVFIPHEHGRQEPRVGTSVGPFHLAIEFRGIRADPIARAGDH